MKPQQLTGLVVKEPYAQGSKSERDAVLLLAEGGRYVLRQQGGNAFCDSALEALVGKTICGTGLLAGQTFILTAWTECAGSR